MENGKNVSLRKGKALLAGAYGSLWAGKRRKRVPPERGARTMTFLLPGWNAQNISSRTPTPLVKCGKTLRLHTFSFNSPGLSILERPLFGYSSQNDMSVQNIPHFRGAKAPFPPREMRGETEILLGKKYPGKNVFLFDKSEDII
jgi:hypothetical protein